MELTLKQKTAFGIGAVGKDMVYALSASYVMYYYQDVLGLSASFVGVVLMAARFFDAFNDPFMGVLVAKTRTRWGRFRPWIFSGTLLNALVLYALFAAPVLDEAALMIYFCVVYILWGVTYTMMDIPYWSMIPAVTRTPKDRENLSMVGRTCAGVGSALIAMFTMLLVGALGGDSERAGFRWVALIVAAIFAVTELVCCISMKETTPSEMKTATVKEMFSALFRNDQAMVVVGSIVLINSALYLTSNFIIYFFKYDLGGAGWKATYTLFSTVGGAAQILGMMVLYPLAAQKVQQYAGILPEPFAGAVRLRHAAGVLPDRPFPQPCPAVHSGRGGVRLQRNADRADHPVPFQQRGLRSAQDRTPGGERYLFHADLCGQGCLRCGGIPDRHRAGPHRSCGQHGGDRPGGSTKRRNPAGSAPDDDRSAHAGAGWCAGAVPPQVCSDRCPRCRDQRTAPRGGNAP